MVLVVTEHTYTWRSIQIDGKYEKCSMFNAICTLAVTEGMIKGRKGGGELEGPEHRDLGAE